MIPEELKKMFGLNNQKDLNMANNVWKMLDQMAESDPQQYKQFVQKNVSEGMQDVKKKSEQKQKPFKIKPNPGACITMTATLSEKPLESQLNQKMMVTTKPWEQIKAKIAPSIKITFNIAHSDRIKDLCSKTSKKPIKKFLLSELKDIEMFYYSLQGPLPMPNNNYHFCMIVNTKFCSDVVAQPNGKRVLIGLCISYLQERLTADRNPLLRVYNPEEYKRLAYYEIEKFSIQISDSMFQYGDSKEIVEFLLEKQVDKKREEEKKKEEKKEEVKPQKSPEIIFKEQPKTEEQVLPEIKLSSEPPPSSTKKPLIQVLKQQQTSAEMQKSTEISYTMKESETSYNFQFLLPGITSIKAVDLEMKSDCVKIKTAEKKELKINLKKEIDEDSIKAKFKKAEHMLRVQAKFR